MQHILLKISIKQVGYIAILYTMNFEKKENMKNNKL